MSAVSDTIALWRVCRSEFENLRLAAHDRATEACNGRLLNRLGMRRGIDSLALFMGNDVYAYAYASDELKEHWRYYSRPVYRIFEKQWTEIQEAERGW